MQNQMIAKIYGKSNKFVINPNNSTGGNSYLNDQYKKPKIQHMKDLIRQNKSQKQSESSVNGNNANGGISTGNSVNHSVSGKEGSSNKPTSKKIKIDNAKIKNMQM